MPELPEVEVVRRDLDDVVRGRTIERVEVGRDRAVRREPDVDAFVEGLSGRGLWGTSRVGKFLVVHLDVSDVVVVHLGMSGQLRVADDPRSPRAPHTHVVWGLDDGRELRFVDPRTFGQMFRSVVGGDGRPRALAHLGPDALLDLVEPEQLGRRLSGRRVCVKSRLMDQGAIAGLGNIYSDEILFRAGVLGTRAAGSLGEEEVGRVHAACATVLAEAVAGRGSSLADAQYVDLYGRPGGFQHAHAVHARAGRPCRACRVPIRRARIGGRFAYWCPRCQT